jgi:hypothetical protein
MLGIFPYVASPQPVDNPQTLELSLARAHLYIVSKSVWPANPDGAVNFCVNRNHSLFESFAKIVPTMKRLSIQLIDERDLEGVKRCHIVVLDKDPAASLKILKAVRKLPVLTMSHEADFTEQGAIVYLSYGERLEPPKIKFEELEASGIKIDASILDLSRRRWGQ